MGVDAWTGAIIVVGVVELFVGGIAAVLACALLWSYSRLRPQDELQVAVSGHRMMIDNLESQIIRLRTQKAGARSAQKKAQAATEQESESEEDPLLDGLTEEDKALFR